jgi:hypothetical protein
MLLKITMVTYQKYLFYLKKNISGGIIIDNTKYASITHIISIIGWGEETMQIEG